MTYRAGDTIDYAFEWTYPGYERFPLGPTSLDAVRDTAAERERQGELEQIWQGLSDSVFAASGPSATSMSPSSSPTSSPLSKRRESCSWRAASARTTASSPCAPELTVWTVESTDADWFDLGVLVEVDGRTIPFTPLFTAMAKGRRKLLLVDGSYLSLNHPALDQLRELIDEASELEEWETGPRHQPVSHPDLWEEFKEIADETLPAMSWLRHGERAAAGDRRSADPVPAGGSPANCGPIRKLDSTGLRSLWTHRLGGILADEMGLGKTVQLLSLVLHAKQAGEERPFLVVAPTCRCLGSWQSEAARFAPGLRVRVIDSSSVKRDAMADAAEHADLVITSYTLVRLDERGLVQTRWAGLIL